jgi:3-oxoacyl-[acyl-carrier protein] reductase
MRSSSRAACGCPHTKCRRWYRSSTQSAYRQRVRRCVQLRNILVSGASRGLGLAITRQLCLGGDRVIAVARKQSDELRSIAKEADENSTGSIQFCACDLSDLDSIPRLIARIKQEFGGPLFGLVNNAAIGTPGVLTSMHDERIESLIRLNVLSPILVTKYAVRSMMSGNGGRIVNIASIVAATGYSGLSAYSASKASLIGFTRSLARELGPIGITVNAVAPGFMSTEMTHDLSEAHLTQIARRSALRRLPSLIDVASAVEFLFSDKARNVTGTTLTVDAGNTA